MRIRPTAAQLVKTGKVLSTAGDNCMVVGSTVLTTFSAILWFCTQNKDNPDGETIVFVGIALMVLVLFCYGTGKILLRERIINSEAFAPEQYALIADELRGRGVSDASRFIREHPEHVRIAHEMTRDIGLAQAYRLEALVYLVDNDPARIADTIQHIFRDRHITDQKEMRELLHTMMETQDAVMTGAL